MPIPFDINLNFTTQDDFFAFGLLVIGFLVYAILSILAARGRFRPHLRRISAFDALDGQVGEAVESGGRMHVSLAGNSIVDDGTSTSMAGLEVLEEVAGRSAISERSTLGTTADPTTLLLAGDAIRAPAERQGLEVNVERTAARLVALDPLTLASGATSIVADEAVTANILVGSFEREAVLITEAGERLGLSQTVGSDRLEGQAIGLVASEHPLIGEELYAAGAYLNARPDRLGSIAAQDIMRWLIALSILVGVALQTMGR